MADSTSGVTPESRLDTPLESTFDSIVNEYGRLRILVVGKSGVGKSSLLQKIFKIKMNVSHNAAGVSDIEKEYLYPDNDRLVVHDSQGYEPGDTENYDRVINFVNERSTKPNLADRVHVIWLCIATPCAGGRVLETGTENLLKDIPPSIAVIVVFTKYDTLVIQKSHAVKETHVNASRDELFVMACSEADADFQQLCAEPINKFMSGHRYAPCIKVSTRRAYAPSLTALVGLTERCGAEAYRVSHLEEGISSDESRDDTPSSEAISPSAAPEMGPVTMLVAVSQRVDIESKINVSIEVGRKRYWQGLASSAHFPGVRLRTCLHVLHKDIVGPWNFNDPYKLLLGAEFEAAISQLSKEGPPIREGRKFFSDSIAVAGSVVGVAAAALSGPAAAIVAPTVFVGIAFAHWVYDTWEAIGGVLCRLMRYIVHLTNVMQGLFYATETAGTYVTKEIVESVTRRYGDSDFPSQIGADIDRFVDSDEVNNWKPGKTRGNVFDELVRLIRKYRILPSQGSSSSMRSGGPSTE
ncbi:hypothetical protein PLICRDRAFT_511021 [Plicaturopsis crispa FD-325 SS-3]|nr:hypothetical protein PLICRDRAFT_511021 [Plicaturopsis crispa FD-325 SS-3]